MKILILGAGQVGSSAAYHLSREEANEVTVVDQSADVLRELQDRLDIRTVVGHAAYPDVLERAGAADMDIIVALTDSDETNMIACQVAYTVYHTPTKIARIRAADYMNARKLFTQDAIPVDVRISPEQLVCEYVEQLILYPGALQVLDFANGRVRLVGARADKRGSLVGQKIAALKEHIPNTEGRIAAIYRDGKSLQPDGNTIIRENDEVFFIAARQDVRIFMSEVRKLEDPVRRVVIAGGGNIGVRLALALEQSNQVKIIERETHKAVNEITDDDEFDRQLKDDPDSLKPGVKFCLHDLRRTFATLSIRNGASIQAVKEAGGWASAEMVMHYTRSIRAEEVRPFLPGENLKITFPDQLPTLEEIGMLAVEEAMRRADGNITNAANLLGITRQGLSKRLKKYSLET